MTPQRRLGFLDGVAAFFGGFAFLAGRRSLWGWALVPCALASTLFLVLAALAIWAGGELVADPAGGSPVGTWVLRVLLGIAGIILAFVVSIALAQPLSGFALDVIVRRQEEALGGRVWPEQPALSAAWRSLRVTLTALLVSLPILGLLTLVTLLFPPASIVTLPLKFLVTGLTITYDFLDYPSSLRGLGVRTRTAFLRRHAPAALGFGLSGAALLLIPGVGLLLLPVGVAGATRLLVAGDRLQT